MANTPYPDDFIDALSLKAAYAEYDATGAIPSRFIIKRLLRGTTSPITGQTSLADRGCRGHERVKKIKEGFRIFLYAWRLLPPDIQLALVMLEAIEWIIIILYIRSI